MKIVFPKPGEVLVCKKCGALMDSELSTAADGDLDFRWCPKCVDYQDSRRVVVEVKVCP